MCCKLGFVVTCCTFIVLGRSFEPVSDGATSTTLPTGGVQPVVQSFTRSKSERFTSAIRKNLFSRSPETPQRSSEQTLTEEELNASKESKKKKKGFFSFGKKKKWDVLWWLVNHSVKTTWCTDDRARHALWRTRSTWRSWYASVSRGYKFVELTRHTAAGLAIQ
ncbi:hypothetical protein Tcan_05009 [Toxocara canis]|uniref:Uncharacterized protein n=1 Tax=Toxocara canis TaxID=6265 RepID=A0A0B2VL55_TOXCA|nr:hypothetical protein Tcan_05009 [Toxocara canis]